jgi:PAS domain S-box-containing protein
MPKNQIPELSAANGEPNGGVIAERAPSAETVASPSRAGNPAARISELELELARTRNYLESIQEQNEATNEELRSAIGALERSKREIAAAREYAEATLRTMPVPFLILRADLRVNTASDAFYRTFGVTPVETEGRLIYELGNGQWNIPKLRELLEDILPQKRSFNGYEIVHDFPAIGKRTMLLNARRMEGQNDSRLILLSIEDVTERMEARATIGRSETRYRRLFEAAQDGILILDPVSRKVTDANPFMTQFLGYSREEFLGKEIWQIGLLQDEQASQAAFRELQNKGCIRYEDLPLETKAGQRREVEFVSNLYDEDGQKVIQCNIRDITERKQADEALRSAMDEIARGARAKDDFLAALSHELRTPLMPVLMTATALESDPSLPDEVREQLGMMRRNIELEARLIDDLLDLTRISHGKLQIAPLVADLHQLLEHAGEIVRSDSFGKKVRITYAFGAARHHALVDPTRLQQVFWNLLKNAVKFTPAGGSVTVRTRNDAEGSVFVSVEDNGIGIGANALPHVFNAFEQGEIAGQLRYGGLGLGLAISRAIVSLHGGAIRAESSGAGCGATFTMTLTSVDAPASPAVASPQQSAPARTLRLLIVEDHDATRTVLERLLTRGGHRVTTASTMREALDAFADETFDAVVSDLGLPDGSGLDLMREIQRRRPVPGIALSGYGMEDDVRQTKEAGFFAHLVKPVNLDQLRQLLDQLQAQP